MQKPANAATSDNMPLQRTDMLVNLSRIFLCVGCFALLPAFATKPRKTSMKQTNCLRTWHIERHTSPWKGLTGDAATEEATFTVRAVETPPAGVNQLAQPAGLDANDFVLFRSDKLSAVVVNARYFSDLTRQDVTGRPLRHGGVIGYAKPAALKRWQAADLLGLLLEQQIILTYAHLEATVCLVAATEKDGVYEAELTGEHIYYTSRRSVSSFRFRFVLERRTGKLRVESLPTDKNF
jgi:hypothetical protein